MNDDNRERRSGRALALPRAQIGASRAAKMKKPVFTDFGDRFVLDFVNTVQYFRGKTTDMIDSPSAVIAWLSFMTENGKIASVQYQKLLADSSWDLPLLGEFRQRLRSFLEDRSLKKIKQFSPYLTDIMTGSPLTFTMRADPETMNLHLVPVPQRGSVSGLLALLSYDAMEMITTDALERVKKCENPTCLAYFINHSGKRKWCSMETCGNRRKSFRHYQRYRRSS